MKKTKDTICVTERRADPVKETAQTMSQDNNKQCSQYGKQTNSRGRINVGICINKSIISKSENAAYYLYNFKITNQLVFLEDP